MKRFVLPFAVLAAALSSCSKHQPVAAAASPAGSGQLLRVGSIVVTQADLDQQLKERHADRSDEGTRKRALEELASRAQFAQAALDAGLGNDPVVRAETARVLTSRLRETTLTSKLRELAAAVPEARLRELYAAGESRFRSGEKRQVAVLWLSPGSDPERTKQYQEKLATARDFLFKNGDLKDHPDQGFSVLSVDYSEHAASRYKGGVVGWLERAGGMDQWTKALAEIAFSLKDPGEVSPVTTRSEGIFLVRFMAQKPAVQRLFESVRNELDQEERRRLRDKLEAEFADDIRAKHPVELLSPPNP